MRVGWGHRRCRVAYITLVSTQNSFTIVTAKTWK